MSTQVINARAQAAQGVITLSPPAAGDQYVFQALDGLKVALGFPADGATMAQDGQNLTFSFPDGGQIVLTDFFAQYGTGAAPSFIVEGQELPGDAFLTAFNADLLPAAGPAGGGGAGSGGVGDYQSDPGALINTVDRLGALDPSQFPEGVPQVVLLENGLIDNGVALLDLTDPTLGLVDGQVFESGLSERPIFDQTPETPGSGEGPTATAYAGTFTVVAPDGLGTLVIDGVTVFGPGGLTGNLVPSDHGTLVVDGYNPATGVVNYTFTLADNAKHDVGSDSLSETFTVTATDTDGDAATGNLSFEIVDDKPVVFGENSEDYESDSVDGQMHYINLPHPQGDEGGDRYTVSDSGGDPHNHISFATLITQSVGSNGFVDIRVNGGTPYLHGEGSMLGSTYDGEQVGYPDGPDRENELGYRDDKVRHEQESIVFKLNGYANHFEMDASGGLMSHEGGGWIPATEQPTGFARTSGERYEWAHGEIGKVTFYLGEQEVGSIYITSDNADTIVYNGLFDRVEVKAVDQHWHICGDNSDFYLKNVVFTEVSAVDVHAGQLGFIYGADGPGSVGIEFVSTPEQPTPEFAAREMEIDPAPVSPSGIWTSDGHAIEVDYAQVDGQPVTNKMVGYILDADGARTGQEAFVIDVQKDGSWTFTQKTALDLPGEQTQLHFNYNVVDSDGDQATGSFNVTVNRIVDRAPDIDVPPVAHVVHESDLTTPIIGAVALDSDGVLPPPATTITGNFVIDAQGEQLTSIKIAGVEFTDGNINNIVGEHFYIGANGKDVSVDGASVQAHAILTITSVSGNSIDGYTVNYSYQLTDNVRHGDGLDDVKTGDIIPVEVSTMGEDHVLQSAKATITVTIVDDTPTASADYATVKEDGNTDDDQTTSLVAKGYLLANDRQGADDASVVRVEGHHDFDNIGSWGQDGWVQGKFGWVHVNANGSYEYQLDNNLSAVQHLIPGETLTDTFTYTIRDGDGDTSSSTLQVTIKGTNDGVYLHCLGDKVEGTVYEQFLPNGTTPNAWALETGVKHFSVDANDGLVSLTVTDGTSTVAIATGAVLNTAYGNLIITSYNANTGDVFYKFRLDDNAPHNLPGGDGTNFDLKLTVNAADRNGDSASGVININIVDDRPNIDAWPEDRTIIEGQTRDGWWNKEFGADNDAGTSIKVLVGSNEYNLGDSIDTGKGILVVNANGTWKFTAANNLDNDETQEQSFKLRITDSDGDVDSDTITVTIKDGATPVGGGAVTIAMDDDSATALSKPDGAATSQTVHSNPDLQFTAGSDDLTFSFATPTGSNAPTVTGLNGTITWSINSDGHLIGSIGDVPTIELSLPDGARISATQTGSVDVTAKLIDPLLHADGKDSITIEGIKVIGADHDGDSVSGTVKLTIADDKPVITSTSHDVATAHIASGSESINFLSLAQQPGDDGVIGNVQIQVNGGTPFFSASGLGVAYDGKAITDTDGPNRENETGYRDNKLAHEQEAVVFELKGIANTFTLNASGAFFTGAEGEKGTVLFYLGDKLVNTLDIPTNGQVSYTNGVLFNRVVVQAADNSPNSVATDNSDFYIQNAGFGFVSQVGKAEGALNVDYHADGPGALTGAATTTGIMTWDGHAITVAQSGNVITGTYTDGGSKTAFTLTLDPATHKWAFVQNVPLDLPADAAGKLAFKLTATDKDNDKAETTINIGIVESERAPDVDTGITPHVVHEAGLSDGSHVYPAGYASADEMADGHLITQGSFRISTNGETLSSVTIAGHSFTATQLAAGAIIKIGAHGQEVGSGEHATLQIIGYDSSTGLVSYKYTLTDNVLHNAQIGGQIFDHDKTGDVIPITVTTGAGTDAQSASATLTVTIVDDVPKADLLVDTATVHAGQHIDGKFDITPGADGIGQLLVNDTLITVTDTNEQMIQGAHGKLFVKADGTYHYDGTSVGNDNFTFKVVDGDGDSASDTLHMTVDRVNTAPTLTMGPAPTAQEAHLVDGSAPHAPAEVVTGSFSFDHNGEGLFASDPLTVGGVAVNLAGFGTPGFTQTISDNVIGKLVITGYNASSGTVSYSYTLKDNTLDPTGPDQKFEVKVKDASGEVDTKQLVIHIADDAPIARDDVTTFPATNITTNLIIVLDTSGSMGDNPNVSGYSSRMALAKDAIAKLMVAYRDLGDVNIKIVGFDASEDGEAPAYTHTGWYADNNAIANANTYLGTNAFKPGGGTDYDDATKFTIDTVLKQPMPTADRSVVYFISDGDPNSGQNLDSAEETAWTNALKGVSNLDIAYAIGIGGNIATTQYLKPVGWERNPDNAANPDADTTFTVSDLSKLDVTLLNTVPVTGSLLANDTQGADGAKLFTVSYMAEDGHIYTATWNGGTVSGASAGHLSASGGNATFILEGGRGSVEFHSDGTYVYIPGKNPTGTPVFDYSIKDGDGDIANAHLTLQLNAKTIDAHDNHATAAVPAAADYAGLTFELAPDDNSESRTVSLGNVSSGSTISFKWAAQQFSSSDKSDKDTLDYSIQKQGLLGIWSEVDGDEVYEVTGKGSTGSGSKSFNVNSAGNYRIVFTADDGAGKNSGLNIQISDIMIVAAAATLKGNVVTDAVAGDVADNLAGMMGTVTEVNGQAIAQNGTYTEIDTNQFGTLKVNMYGQYEYKANPGTSGHDEAFVYKLVSTTGQEDHATLNIHVGGTDVAQATYTSGKVTVGGHAADTLTGTDGDDYIIGGKGDDIIDGKGGRDYIDGGAGNDTIITHDTTGDHRITDADFKGLHGGSGIDTLLVADAGVTLDFTNIANGKVTGFEKIDLRSAGSQNLILDKSAVLDLDDNADHQIMILGTDADSVKFVQSNPADFVKGTDVIKNVGGTDITFNDYKVMDGTTEVHVLVQQEIIKSGA